MSNSIAPGSSVDVNVRVTALTTNPNVPVTYKTVILKKNLVNGVNTLTQEMMSTTNTKYVVKYDYVLGEDITVPINCVLEFDGGSITQSNNYSLSGSVLNSYLDISNFTTDGTIDWALPTVLSLSNAFIPKGQWTLTSTINIPTGKTIFGSGLESKILLQNASIRLYKVVQTMIKDIELIVESSSNVYAITFNGGVRNSTIQDIAIRGSIAYSGTSVCCGILFKEDVTEEYIGNVGIVINNVFIKDVKIGMCLDSNTQPSTDYITSSRFDNIYIDRFNDTAIKIIGTRNYTCNFNGITIDDNMHNGQTHYGLYFDGGYLNNFTNLTIWADARNTTDKYGNPRFQDPNEFYAVYIARELQAIGTGYITGYIEGMIGGIEAYNVFFDRFQYDIYFCEVSSLDATKKYQGWMSNYISTHCSFKSILDFHTIKYSYFELVSGTNINVIPIPSGIKIYKTNGQDEAWNVRFMLDRYLSAGKKYRLFALFDCEQNSSEDLGIKFRLIEGQSTKSYLNAASRFKNHFVSSTFSGSVENAVEGNSSTIELRIETSVKTLILKEFYIIEYTPDYPIDFITKVDSIKFVNKEHSDILAPTNPINRPVNYMTYKYINNKVIPVWAQTNNVFTEYDSAVAGVKRVGTFAEKPTSTDIYIGFKYFCTDKQTVEGATDGIEIIHKGNNVWVDALGRVVS